jgi:predicted metal-dependent hydrolase
MQKSIEVETEKIEYTLKVSKRARRMRLVVYCDGETVVTAPRFLPKFLVERYVAEKTSWILEKLDNFRPFRERPPVRTAREKRAEYLKYKGEARVVVEKHIARFNQIYNFSFNKITIKNQKTRWGSCSKKGNLNFNYKIALLPERLAEYLVVHELCHLGELNHSKKFWTLVAHTIPDYTSRRRELKSTPL